MIADKIVEDLPVAGNKAGGNGLDTLLAKRGVNVVTYSDWQKIDRAEQQRAREGAPREKFVCVEEMIEAGRIPI